MMVWLALRIKVKLEVLSSASGGGFLLCVLGMGMWDAYELVMATLSCYVENHRYSVVLRFWVDLIKGVMLFWGMLRMSGDVGYMPGFAAHYWGAAIGKGGKGNGPKPLAGSALMWFFVTSPYRVYV